jgi:hypothetical protein
MFRDREITFDPPWHFPQVDLIEPDAKAPFDIGRQSPLRKPLRAATRGDRGERFEVSLLPRGQLRRFRDQIVRGYERFESIFEAPGLFVEMAFQQPDIIEVVSVSDPSIEDLQGILVSRLQGGCEGSIDMNRVDETAIDALEHSPAFS